MSRLSGILILRYSQTKGKISYGFYCFENPSSASLEVIKCPIVPGFSAKGSALSD